MDNKFLILFLSPSPRLGYPGVIGINVLFDDLGSKDSGKEVHCVLLSNVHHDLVIGISENVVLELGAYRRKLAQAVVGQEKANVGLPAKGNKIIQTWVSGG